MLTVNDLIAATGGTRISGAGEKMISHFSIDSRTLKKNDCFIAIKGDNFDGHDFIPGVIARGVRCVIGEKFDSVCSKNNNVILIKVKDTKCALGDIARFIRQRCEFPVIAVTGSAGKTTVKDMASWVLAQRFNVIYNKGTKNNHIGVPLTLLETSPAHNLAVLELGTNHFGEIAYLARIVNPAIAVITNIGPAHLEHFKDIKGVFKEKYSLTDYLREPAIAVLNADDPVLRKEILKSQRTIKTVSYGVDRPADFRASKISISSGKLEFYVNKKHKFILNTLGYNNVYNALAAIAVARVLGMSYPLIAARMSLFKFPKGRLTSLVIKKAQFIDDTYNSNPLSLRNALDVFKRLKAQGRKIFVMGDMLELGSHAEKFHRQAGAMIPSICDIFITVGKLSGLAAEKAGRGGLRGENIFKCATSSEASEVLWCSVKPGNKDAVLVKGSRGMKMEEVLKGPVRYAL